MGKLRERRRIGIRLNDTDNGCGSLRIRLGIILDSGSADSSGGLHEQFTAGLSMLTAEDA